MAMIRLLYLLKSILLYIMVAIHHSQHTAHLFIRYFISDYSRIEEGFGNGAAGNRSIFRGVSGMTLT